jgi:hypothetical protein
MPSTRDFIIGWIVWALVGLAWEMLALRHTGGHDTLSDQVRWVLAHPFAWWCGIGLAVWAGGHFFFGWR